MHRPLDKNNAHFYGQFVQAAYAMFKNPDNRDPLRPEPIGIPDGYELGAWIHMSDFIFDVEEPQFYGIVAHDKQNPDTRVIAIRGTEGAVEWIDDAAAILVPFRQVASAGRVAYGFDKIYGSLKVIKRPLPGVPPGAEARVSETYSGSFAEQLDQEATSREDDRAARSEARPAVERHGHRARPTVVTGHSLGAALATLFIMENDLNNKFDISTCCTFASPRVGNSEFARKFNQLPIDSWRIVNIHDVVPRLPLHIPFLFDYTHVDMAYPFDSFEFAKNSLLCRHTMETYLHWLDPRTALLPECTP